MPKWSSFLEIEAKAQEIWKRRRNDPLCHAIALYYNGELQGKWVISMYDPIFIDAKVYEEVG